VKIDPRYYRPPKVDSLLDNLSKAKKELGWQHICPFWDLVSEREHKNQYKAINND
jgi:GDP-D-mannose dehydratase